MQQKRFLYGEFDIIDGAIKDLLVRKVISVTEIIYNDDADESYIQADLKFRMYMFRLVIDAPYIQIIKNEEIEENGKPKS